MAELANLRSVPSTAGYPRLRTLQGPPTIVAIIPTVNRPQALTQALSSVSAQTRQPNQIIVVRASEPELGLSPQEASTPKREAPEGSSPVLTLANKRTRNLSGSLNTAICYLLDAGLNPEGTFVAFLDDDDTWESCYLQTCAALAEEQDLDWVISGIIRHEAENDAGLPLSIPETVRASEFLVKNPHIQGSSLFVRLSTLLAAGCFDENLPSTTDRDICIRLANLDPKTGFVPKHLVHHMAFGNNRLSTPGSEAKRIGLKRFYGKYGPLMSQSQRAVFLERAVGKFQCPMSDFEPAIGESS